MRLTIFLLSWGLVVVVSMLYVCVGTAIDVVVRRNRAARERVLAVLAVILFEDDSEAGQIHGAVLELPRRPLLAVLQSLAVDLEGQANQRVHQLVRSTGLEKYIRNRARSRRWRMRVQAAQLQHLVTHPDFDRGRLLRDRRPLVRARAAESLKPEHAVEHVDELLAMLCDPSAAVRLSAQHSLLGAGSAAVPSLLEHLSSDDQPLALQALEVAANIADPRLVDALNARASSADPSIRAMAGRVLGNGSGALSVEVLHGLLEDDEPTVRVTAIESLARLEVLTSVTRIGELLSDRSYPVRRAAGLALDNLGPSGHLVLRQRLEDPDKFGRDMARQVLDSVAARRGVTVVPPAVDPLLGLNEGNPYVEPDDSAKEPVVGQASLDPAVGASP